MRTKRRRQARSFRQAARWMFEDMPQDERESWMQSLDEMKPKDSTEAALIANGKKFFRQFFADHPPKR